MRYSTPPKSLKAYTNRYQNSREDKSLGKPNPWRLPRPYIALLALLFMPLDSGAGQSPCTCTPTDTSLRQTTVPLTHEELAKTHSLESAVIGYQLFDVLHGKVLTSYNADKLLIPASTAKLLTALWSLSVLGPEFRFQTHLTSTGYVDKNTLKGDLYLVGGADPSLTTNDLSGFADALLDAGIEKVEGRLFFDDTLIPESPYINADQPTTATYNPGLSALSINYNRVVLSWKASPGTNKFTPAFYSPADGQSLPVNNINIEVKRNNLNAGPPFVLIPGRSDKWLMSPTLPERGTKVLPVKQFVGLVTASLFRTYCERKGILMPQPASGRAPKNTRIIHKHYSQPLWNIMKGGLKYSNNLTAELVGLVASLNSANARLPMPKSASLMTQWIRGLHPRLDWNGFSNINHSGLSRKARYSASHLACILQHAFALYPKGSTNGGVQSPGFEDLLPRLNWEEELGPNATTVAAKSGTMSYADGLVGILRTSRNNALGFAILVTDFEERKIYDSKMLTVTPTHSKKALDWTERAKSFEKALLKQWSTLH